MGNNGIMEQPPALSADDPVFDALGEADDEGDRDPAPSLFSLIGKLVRPDVPLLLRAFPAKAGTSWVIAANSSTIKGYGKGVEWQV